jgi:hypothetical protein
VRTCPWSEKFLPNKPSKFFDILASATIHARYGAVYSVTYLTALRRVLPLSCKNRGGKSRRVEVQLHSFVTWALDGNERSAIILIHFTPGKEQFPIQ